MSVDEDVTFDSLFWRKVPPPPPREEGDTELEEAAVGDLARNADAPLSTKLSHVAVMRRLARLANPELLPVPPVRSRSVVSVV